MPIQSTQVTFTFTVNSPTLQINTATLPDATVGTPYSYQFTATGGVLPLVWSVDPSTPLPDGLVLGGGGLLTGTPTATFMGSVTILVHDSGT